MINKAQTLNNNAAVHLLNAQAGAYRCRANFAHIRQSTPDSGLGFTANSLEMF